MVFTQVKKHCLSVIRHVFKEVYVLKGREDRRLMPVIHALEEQGILVQVANRQWLEIIKLKVRFTKG